MCQQSYDWGVCSGGSIALKARFMVEFPLSGLFFPGGQSYPCDQRAIAWGQLLNAEQYLEPLIPRDSID